MQPSAAAEHSKLLHTSAADPRKLRDLLTRLRRSWPPVAAASPTQSDTESLVQLQQAAAALQHSSTCQPGADADNALLACSEALVQMLLQPPEQLLSGLGGAPSEPATGMELAGGWF
jgi:hypothetical protein